MPKLKTHKGASKRFKKTGSGKVVRHHAFARHILTSKAAKRKRRLREGVVAEHRAHPGDDLICAMIAVEEQGDSLTEQELLSTCSLLFAAGHETTTNLIGNGMLALLRNPEQLAILRSDGEQLTLDATA